MASFFASLSKARALTTFTFSLLLVTVGMCFSPRAEAFFRSRWEETGVKLFWSAKDLPLPWAYGDRGGPDSSLSEKEFDHVIQAAYDAWLATGKVGIAFKDFGPTKNQATFFYLLDGINDPDLGLATHHLVTKDWMFSSGTIAVTITFPKSKSGDLPQDPKDVRDGSILDSDILYNATNFHFCSDRDQRCETDDKGRLPMDLLTVASHEIGHQIGFNHQPSIAAAVMYPKISPGEIKDLSLDEVRAAVCVYGDESDEKKTACHFEENPGGGPGSGTYIWGSGDTDLSACGRLVPSASALKLSNNGNSGPGRSATGSLPPDIVGLLNVLFIILALAIHRRATRLHRT